MMIFINFKLLENGIFVTQGRLDSVVTERDLLGNVSTITRSNVGKKKIKQEITEYRIKIITRNPIYFEVYINFVTGKIMSNSALYTYYSNTAQHILSMLTFITDECTALPPTNTSYSPADEIVKYKKLLDDGIITQEEFNHKKQQLLDL